MNAWPHPGILLLAGTLLLGCGPQPRQPMPAFEPGVNIEGLQQVESRNFEVAFARPGVRFSRYEKLLVNELELAFHTPDRSQNQFPLGEDQKTRFRAAMATAFGREWRAAPAGASATWVARRSRSRPSAK
jgi:hypothetical protein